MKRASCWLFAFFFPVAAWAANWTQLGPFGADARVIVRNPRNASEVYVAAYSSSTQIYRSTDGGGAWKRAAVMEDILYDIVVHPATGGLYALADTSFHKSADQGKTWASFSLGSGNSGFWGCLAAGYFMDASHQLHHRLYKSGNGGKTWAAFTPGLLLESVTGLDINTATKTLFAATYGAGVWKRKL